MTDERVERRLAAILAADVAGYSRLMGEDEEGTLRRLQAHRDELIDPKVREHRGRIVKTTGDGLLVEFASVVDAVRCAAEVQRGMVEREVETPEDRRIRFRIGINLGDVIVEGGDIFGDGVNIAARLEGLAAPGGICISATVREHVGERLPYAFTDLGEQKLKNIARPLRAYAIGAAVEASPPSAVATRPPPRRAASRRRPAATRPRLSIVVLPLANLSNDPDQEYFADAITDDLTTDLSRISGSFVISRTTAFTYKGKAVDVKTIGRDLGVRYVLEGSVRRLGQEVQINVQLIDADSGAHAWADRFNTDLANLAKAQEEITGRLARTLDIVLVQAAGHQTDAAKNPDARDLILRGWASYYTPVGKAQAQKTLELFEQALALDPQSIDARVGAAIVLTENVIKDWSGSRNEDLARADQLLREVFARDSNNAKAHYALGQVRVQQGRLTEAKVAYERTIELDRNFSAAILTLGHTLVSLGQPEVALPYFEKPLWLNPRNPNIFYNYFGLGFCHLLLDHADEAVDFFRKAYASAPPIWYVPLGFAAALGLKGDNVEAQEVLHEFYKLKPEINSIAKLRALLRVRYSIPKYAELADKTCDLGLRRAGMPEE